MKPANEGEIERYKELILVELRKIKREGIENLIDFLENKSDYFRAPASTRFHGCEIGDLARHSYQVFLLLEEKNKRYKLGLSHDTVALTALLHDVCKANFYAIEKKWTKDENNQWIEVDKWSVHDKFPIGHGEKSVIVIQRFINLTDEEAMMIRWHMVAFDPGIHFNYPSGYPFNSALAKYKGLTALFTADYEASNIIGI